MVWPPRAIRGAWTVPDRRLRPWRRHWKWVWRPPVGSTLLKRGTGCPGFGNPTLAAMGGHGSSRCACRWKAVAGTLASFRVSGGVSGGIALGPWGWRPLFWLGEDNPKFQRGVNFLREGMFLLLRRIVFRRGGKASLPIRSVLSRGIWWVVGCGRLGICWGQLGVGWGPGLHRMWVSFPPFSPQNQAQTPGTGASQGRK